MGRINNRKRSSGLLRIAIIGPQGSGKGTQVELLKEKYALSEISVGEHLRELAQKRTPIGLKLKKYWEKGKLVPDKLLIPIVKRLIEKQKNGIIFDGFPRTMTDAKFLMKNYPLTATIYLKLKDKDAVKRISQRKECINCGAIHKKTAKKNCEKCGGELKQRDDDKPKTIKTRLKIYHKTT